MNISTWGRWSPLHFAAACKKADGQRARAIARMLLEAGANMYAVNAHGQTPFDCLLEVLVPQIKPHSSMSSCRMYPNAHVQIHSDSLLDEMIIYKFNMKYK